MSHPLNDLISLNQKQFVTFVAISLTAAFFIVFAVLQIMSSYSKYRNAKINMELTYKPASSDNYDIVKHSGEDSTSQYRDDTIFAQNMTRSLAEYKSYNERLKQYYKENRPDETPKDLIDNSIFNPNADMY
jgi:hypothetical protein